MDIGSILAVGSALVAVVWGLLKIMFSQFEKRQDERFTGLQTSITTQKTELDGHLGRQDLIMGDIRRVESELARCQVDAANKYQTKSDAGNQFSQLIQEIRGLGNRIDSLHGRRGDGVGQQ